MYCTNCGGVIDENSIFCTSCGKRIKDEPVVTVAQQEAQDSDAVSQEKVPEEAPVQPAAESAEEIPMPFCASYAAGYNEQPIMPFVPEKQQPEKVYFGKGALAFCLVVIGLLAISTGVFAGLYFSLL